MLFSRVDEPARKEIFREVGTNDMIEQKGKEGRKSCDTSVQLKPLAGWRRLSRDFYLYIALSRLLSRVSLPTYQFNVRLPTLPVLHLASHSVTQLRYHRLATRRLLDTVKEQFKKDLILIIKLHSNLPHRLPLSSPSLFLDLEKRISGLTTNLVRETTHLPKGCRI